MDFSRTNPHRGIVNSSSPTYSCRGYFAAYKKQHQSPPDKSGFRSLQAKRKRAAEENDNAKAVNLGCKRSVGSKSDSGIDNICEVKTIGDPRENDSPPVRTNLFQFQENRFKPEKGSLRTLGKDMDAREETQKPTSVYNRFRKISSPVKDDSNTSTEEVLSQSTARVSLYDDFQSLNSEFSMRSPPIPEETTFPEGMPDNSPSESENSISRSSLSRSENDYQVGVDCNESNYHLENHR